MLFEENYTVFSDHLSLGIPIIDDQHTNLVRMTNNLQYACLKGQETASHRFLRSVEEIINFSHLHFQTEEKLMSLFGFNGLRDHKKEHEEFLWNMLEYVKMFQEGQSSVPDRFVCLLADWIQSHISVSDKLFADYFLSMESHSKMRLTLTMAPEWQSLSA